MHLRSPFRLILFADLICALLARSYRYGLSPWSWRQPYYYLQQDSSAHLPTAHPTPKTRLASLWRLTRHLASFPQSGNWPNHPVSNLRKHAHRDGVFAPAADAHHWAASAAQMADIAVLGANAAAINAVLRDQLVMKASTAFPAASPIAALESGAAPASTAWTGDVVQLAIVVVADVCVASDRLAAVKAAAGQAQPAGKANIAFRTV
jgi:hypothetical protein